MSSNRTDAPGPQAPHGPWATAARAAAGLPPRLGCHAQHARRLLVAATIFALSLVVTLVLVAAFILRDLSEAHVNQVLTQARDEAEAVARMANDPGTMGEGETVDAVEAGQDREVDAEALLADLLPEVYDEEGQKVDPLQREPRLGMDRGLSEEVPPGEGAASRPRRMPANLSRRGEEWRLLVNGELVQRDAFQYIEIKYPGGRQILSFRKSELKDFDRSVLNDPTTHAERQQILWRPSSQRITIAWDSTLNGQPVTLQAGIDAAVLEEGIAELRRRTIPKILAGAATFVVLLGVAYAYVFRLLGEARRQEAAASQQALLAQVGLLAAGLAHEIRNPLSAVQMNLQLLEEDLEEAAGAPPLAPASAPPGARASARPTASSDHVAVLQATQKEIRRLGSLVSDFLTYARPATPRPAAVRVDALVRDCIELFRAKAAGLGVHVDTDLKAGDEPVLLDEAMLKQALMNVLKNAIEAVPHPGGRVTVSTHRSSGALKVAVADNGPGLPEDPDELFRVFHSTKKGGTGLGLPISRALAERQGGRLTAQHGAGGGAVFALVLPAEAAPVAPAPAVPGPVA